ncbi:hypothetical protein LTR53_010468 [Teratosphaeriaceae sp. CCFEE 6253]|nr:hypothetical protein LTR53_010468 [Teratosphaeriaceae sp. CCFEE 6253]
MEDGSGDGDRQRRKTFSGALRLDHAKDRASSEAMRVPWSSPSAPSSPTSLAPSASVPAARQPTPPRPHRRTISGSILQRLNFLRPANSDSRPPSRDKEPTSPRSAKSRKSIDDDSPIVSPTSPKGDSAMSFALRPAMARKRKGSLRKTALLGGKRIMSESRERKNSVSAKSPLAVSSIQPQTVEYPHSPRTSAAPIELQMPNHPASLDGTSTAGNQISPDDSPAVASGSNDDWAVEAPAVSAARLSLVTDHKARQPSTASSTASSTTELLSPLDIRSPTSQTSYASTTSDDDMLTFDRPVAQPSTTSLIPMSSAATSYFPLSNPSSVSLPHKSKHARSPLSHTITSSSQYPPSPPPHDYTETAYWGYVILLVTWLTFTVGMGSCLGIWSWAWDVGETPYAPPELEDDPTLPIVGYYPALMVLTGVVAWVWVVVAWVGMKYFRHAGIEV